MAPAKIRHMGSLVRINGCESWTEKMIGYKSVCITSKSFCEYDRQSSLSEETK